MQNKLFTKMHSGMKKAFALTLAATTVFSSIQTTGTSLAATVGTIEEVPSYTKYYEPFSLDADRDGNAETIWSTFTYGEYPQSQVTNAKELACLESMSEDNWYAMENPYITYKNGSDAVQTVAYGYYGNDCYLRMKMNDTNCGSTSKQDGYYAWDDADTYHYFKFEPITWRILSIGDDGTNALAVSDQVLDCQVFNYSSKDVYFNGSTRNACDWKYSTLRSFVNSYDATHNAYKADYSEYGFKFLAFGDEELAIIPANKISNKEGAYANIYGSSTNDQFFCLSYDQLTTKKFGFNSDEERVAFASDYAKQMGAFGYATTSFWWTRSAGNDYKYVSCVDYMGDIHKGGDKVSYNDIGVRPAMYIDLTKVSSDAFTGYVDAKGNSYSNKVTFKLDGAANAYALVNKNDSLVNLPYNYEQDGYDYTYTYGNKTLEFPMKTSKNFTVNVNRTVQKNTITVYYKASSSWKNAYIHYRVADGTWTDVPGVKMEKTSELDGYNYKFVIPCKDATNATMCFNNGNGTWDNNGNANYKLNALGVYAIKNRAITTLSVVPTATPEVTVAPTAKVTASPVVTVTPTAEVTASPVVTVAPTAEVTASPVVTVAPTETPVENPITVYYKNDAWKTAYIHYKVDNGDWTVAPGIEMTATTERKGYTYKYEIDANKAETITLCFTNGNGAWDNNNRANYTLNLSKGSYFGISNTTLKTLPEDPNENTITVYYSTGWATPYIHFKIGNGDWTTAPGVAMEATQEQSGYNFKYVINIGEEDNAVVCFNNGNNSWDSKNGANYTLSSSGVYGVRNGVITTLQ